MRGQIVAAQVSFGFHDDTGDGSVHEHFAQQLPGDFDRRALVESPFQNRTVAHPPHCTIKSFMRLFIGLDLPAEVVRNLETLLDRLRPQARINWSPPAHLPTPTKFIAETPQDGAAQLTKDTA